ncbi:class I adenylate-forming enzyme family protein [Nocardiopsis sp. FIRDI 009]|uniref:class I adenylate-forming enzyme family protein n=1 Tax=Nocardiopsis sp. FIRDI 009 TaxID=714197 RepID=UPI000E21CED3|nr:fatty acid--CoA ligase family protein [Nocardiopsis sp. FIRDI 009]
MQALKEAMSSFGNSQAIVSGNSDITYEKLLSEQALWVDRFTQAGVSRGSVTALQADYSAEGVAALLALMELKAICVPLSPLPEAKRQEFLQVSSAEHVVDLHASTPATTPTGQRADHELYARLRELESAGLVLFSSGTTGRSKASVLNLESLVEAHIGERKRPRRTMTFLNFDHIGGVNTLMHALAHGGTVITTPRRTPDDVLRTVQETQVQVLPTTPTFLTMCLIGQKLRDYDLSSLQVITYGTEPMPEQTLKKLHEELPNVQLKQTYGLSELGIMSTKSRSDDSLWVKLGGAGFDYKVIDGLLWVKSDKAMLGYLNAAYSFDEDGYFNTQDQVEVDGEYVKILGRRSELINVAGLKVYPNEVESVILEVPNVADVTVFGRKNPVTGQVVQARVKPVDGNAATDLEKAVLKHCGDRLEDYKVPVRVEISEEAHHSNRFKKARA